MKKRQYSVYVSINTERAQGVWIDVSYKAYNNLIKSLIKENYEISYKDDDFLLGKITFISANERTVASILERKDII